MPTKVAALPIALAAAVGAAGAARAQEVAACDGAPPVTALVEPWEETAAVLADGAVRLAAIEAGQGAVALLVLTLPPAGPPADPDAAEAPMPDPAEPLVPRRCRIVTEGGPGFAGLDLLAIEAAEDAGAGTFVATLPVLRFIPESSELEEVALRLTFGVADDSLVAELGAELGPELGPELGAEGP